MGKFGNEKYAAPVPTAGHVPVATGAEEHIELLPRPRRTINSCDGAELNPFRCQRSGAGSDGRGRDVHYDPYGMSRVWVRNHRQGGWITRSGATFAPPRCPWASWPGTTLAASSSRGRAITAR
ncbi:hypothetical protein GCM10010207_51190 [Streptomyces atratus]|nr:hypothetical protein GCM10010207_51190 [Streptomyces atratus]